MSLKSKIALIASGTLLCLRVAVLLMPSGSGTQLVPSGGNVGQLMYKEDFIIANAAARKLLEPYPAAPGAIVAWNNPASGNSGVLTMGRAYQKDGDNCRVVKWRDVFKEGAERLVVLDTCHIDGVWKLM